MYRKLIIIALAGAFLLGLAAHGLATKTTGGPAYQRTADGLVTSNWPGVQGTSTGDLLASMSRGATITTTKAASSEPAKMAGGGSTGATNSGMTDKTKVNEKSEKPQKYAFRRFDTRDPRNHVIRPGGLVVRP